MISGVTRQALLDLFESYDPNPDLTAAGLLFGGQPERHRPLQWWGRLDEVEFMSRLYDLDSLPSTDERYSTCREDIIQHCIANCDWEASWPLRDDRFISSTSDADLLRFLAETLHPEVRSDPDDVSRLLDAYNRLLRPDGAEIIRSGTISRRPVYVGGAAVPRNIQPATLRDAIGQAVRNNLTGENRVIAFCDELGMPSLKEGSLAAPGSSKAQYVTERLTDCTLTELEEFGRAVAEAHRWAELDELLIELEMAASAGTGSPPKNLIFASDGPKPDLVLIDSLDNEIQIVNDDGSCLIYTRKISSGRGLSFRELVEWWRAEHSPDASTADQAARLLYDRLESGLNEPERETMEAYRELLRTHGFDLPALIPQVYLHFDPKTIKQRLAGDGKKLERQRMDFLLLLPNSHRVVVELDGIEHYTDMSGKASPRRYAEMVREDRRLKLTGYDVYRVGGFEFKTLSDGREVVRRFFEELLDRYGVTR